MLSIRICTSHSMICAASCHTPDNEEHYAIQQYYAFISEHYPCKCKYPHKIRGYKHFFYDIVSCLFLDQGIHEYPHYACKQYHALIKKYFPCIHYFRSTIVIEKLCPQKYKTEHGKYNYTPYVCTIQTFLFCSISCYLI